jgi:hypothetical protein
MTGYEAAQTIQAAWQVDTLKAQQPKNPGVRDEIAAAVNAAMADPAGSRPLRVDVPVGDFASSPEQMAQLGAAIDGLTVKILGE